MLEILFTYKNIYGSWSDIWATSKEHAIEKLQTRDDCPFFITIYSVKGATRPCANR